MADEKVALQAMELVDEDGEGTAAEAETADGLLKLARKTPNALPKGSPQYWKAIANQTVRMYCAFVTEANSAAGMTAAVEKENLPRGEAGKSCILCHLDTSCWVKAQVRGAKMACAKCGGQTKLSSRSCLDQL